MFDQLPVITESLPALLDGAVYTIILSLGGMFFGLMLGFLLALGRLYAPKPVQWLALVHVSFSCRPAHLLRSDTAPCTLARRRHRTGFSSPTRTPSTIITPPTSAISGRRSPAMWPATPPQTGSPV